MSELDASTDSGDSSQVDIAPSKFDHDGIDLSGIHAVLSWVGNHDSNNASQHLCHSTHDHLTLQIHHGATSNTAFFQVTANIALKARRDRTNVYLSINPERIRTVELAEDDGNRALAADKLGTSVYCLQFSLATSAALIVPQGDLTPKHKSSRAVLDSLQALLKQTKFSVYLPALTLTRARLTALCESVSSGNVRASAKFMDTASLYGGKGGRVIQHVPEAAVPSVPAAAAAAEIESPPSYDELSMSSPPRPSVSQKSGAKRRRVDTSEDACLDKPRLSMSIEVVCERMMERIETGFTELGSRLDRMERRLTGLETCMESHAEKLGVRIENAHHRSSQQVDDLRDEVDNQLHDIRRETQDTITIQVEDEMYVARDQLEDFVKDEIAHVEERLENRLEESLSNASVSLDFSWNR